MLRRSAVAIAAEGKEERGSCRERRRLSRRMARLMNCSRVLPSSRQASSDCSSWLRPLRKRSLRGSASLHPVCAASVRNDSQIKSLLLSHHHSTSALVSEILMSVLQTVQKTKQKQKTTIYIWTVHIYRLYRRQCAKYTYIYSVHIVYCKDILNYQLHIIHRMCTSTLCTLSIHYVVYT